MLRTALLAATILIALPAAAEEKRDFGNATTDRFAMVMSRARVMKLAEICGLRPKDWVDQVDAMIHSKVPDLAERVSDSMNASADAGIGAAWGGLIIAMDLARIEHNAYGDQSCKTLASSDDLRVVDMLVGYSTNTKQPAPKRRS